VLGERTKSGHVGILGTVGTINSGSYPIELAKFAPTVEVHQHACPMWVPLIENQQYEHQAGRLFIEEDIHAIMGRHAAIDTILLACTHYPVLKQQIEALVGPKVQVVAQGAIVAEKLKDYLVAHPEIEQRLTKTAKTSYYTSEAPHVFDQKASYFLKQEVTSKHHSF
jgi:glutamate racemase